MSATVSVIVPTHNRREMLLQALQSVDSQTLKDWELWVVDDGSQDGSSGAVEQHFPKARLLRLCPGLGASSARNLALEQAQGRYIAFLDDDDLWHPTFLERMVGALERFPTASLAFSDHTTVGVDGVPFRPDLRPVRDYPSLQHFLLSEAFVHAMSLVVCRGDAVRKVGFMKPTLICVQDLDFYYRLLSAGTFVYVPENLVQVRLHDSNLTGQRGRWYREELLWLAQQVRLEGRLNSDAHRLLAYRTLYHASGFWKAGEPWQAARLATEAWLRCPWFTLTTAVKKWRRRSQFERPAKELVQSGLHVCAS